MRTTTSIKRMGAAPHATNQGESCVYCRRATAPRVAWRTLLIPHAHPVRRNASAWAAPLHRTPDPASPGYMWLVDLLDNFGVAGGFDGLRSVCTSDKITPVESVALIRPFGGKVACMLRSGNTFASVFVHVRDKLIRYLEQLPGPNFLQQYQRYVPFLPKALRVLKDLERRTESGGQTIDQFRLNMCMRLLSCESFDRQMDGLAEVTGLVDEANSQSADGTEQFTWLSRPRLEEWMRGNMVLQKLLGMNLHMYTEDASQIHLDRLCAIIRFLIEPRGRLADRLAADAPQPILDLILRMQCPVSTVQDGKIAANILQVLSQLVPELDGPAATDNAFQLLQSVLVDQGAIGLQTQDYKRLLMIVKTVVRQATCHKQTLDDAEARAKQSANAAAWATIESLPNYCTYSSMQTELVSSRDPTYALLAAELQRTATQHSWSTTGPLQQAPQMEVVRIERILNRRLQDSYLAELQNTIGLCRKLPADKMNDVQARRVQTYAGLPMNEFFLYHGADSSKIERLQRSGLDPRYAGTNRGKMFGVGTYLASNSSKSDLYTKPNAAGERCILLVRATLGEPARLTSPQPNLLMPPERPDKRGPLSSVVGMTTAEGGRLQHREYIVYHTAHTLPQFAIWYKHAQGCGCTNCVRPS